MPYLRNQAKHRISNYNGNRNVNERFSSELAEKIRKNAWTNLPELLRQIALANAQKQQQERGGSKIGYLQQVSRRDFKPSILASTESENSFDNEPRTRLRQQTTSSKLQGHGNMGRRSMSKSRDQGDSSKMNEDEKHLLYHNIQMKNGGIKWTRGIFVKPDSELSDDQSQHDSPSSNNRFNEDTYKTNHNENESNDRKNRFKSSKFTSIDSQGLYTKRNGSDNHSSTRLINQNDSLDKTFASFNGYNRQKYPPRRRNIFNQGYGDGSGDSTEESIQLGTTASGSRKHFPKRQSNPLEIVSERRIDDAIITSSLPRQGKQSSFERQITDSIATLSSEGLSKLENQKQWNDRESQDHREWWRTFQQRSGLHSRNTQRRRSRSLVFQNSSRES